MIDDTCLWQPSPDAIEKTNIHRFGRWLREQNIVRCDDYSEMLEWSIEQPDAFWSALIDYFGLPVVNAGAATDGKPMPDTRWFPGATLNYMDQVYRHIDQQTPAVIAVNESGEDQTLSWREMQRQAAALAATLRAQGVSSGDRVVAYLPNVTETIIAFHAVASIGAVWSVCAPDLGVQGVVDRFAQIEPVCLIAANGYQYGGKPFARDQEVTALLQQLPTLRACVWVRLLDDPTTPQSNLPLIEWSQATSGDAAVNVEVVEFSHPLWIVYSSGTTGKPKAIVHSHGGIVLEHVKQMRLQLDLNAGDRFLWFSSTAWMMWNYNIGALLTGTTACLFDGNPGKPDLYALWEKIDRLQVNVFGAGAAFYDACRQAGISPSSKFEFSALRGLGSTGSPLSPEGFDWIYSDVKQDIYLSSISGGTDFATACVGGSPTLPVYRGEIGCRSLGCAVFAFDPDGQSVIDEVGELVITKPMPSMPIEFWADPGKVRYRESYFSMYPDVWQHGDWIKMTSRGSAIIYGRSDATINRQGIRMGTADIYNRVETEPEIVDSLIVDLEYLGRDSYLPLFVVLADGETLTDALKAKICAGIRTDLSPRHVPDDVFVIDAVPRTFSGKKMEIPVRRVLLGQAGADSINRDTMSNPESIDWFLAFASRLAQSDAS